MDLTQLQCEEFASVVENRDQAKKLITALARHHRINPVEIARLAPAPTRKPGLELDREDVLDAVLETASEFDGEDEDKAAFLRRVREQIADAVLAASSVVVVDGVAYDTDAFTYWDALRPVLNTLYEPFWTVRESGDTGTFFIASEALECAQQIFEDDPERTALTLVHVDPDTGTEGMSFTVSRPGN